MNTLAVAPRFGDSVIASCAHQRTILLPSGKLLLLVADRPFPGVATEVLRDAIRGCKSAPSVLGGASVVYRTSKKKSLAPTA